MTASLCHGAEKINAVPSSLRVLLIAPRFFGYEAEIKKCLEKKGAIVDWLPDRPFDKAWHLTILRLLPKLMLSFVNIYYLKKLNDLPISQYNIIFAVNTVTLSPKIIAKIKQLNPAAKYVIYMWDSMKNRDHVKHVLGFFDSKWSFDPETALQYGMKFRPLFYVNEYKNCKPVEINNDLIFIGTIHSDRYLFIKKLQKIVPRNFKCFYYLYLKSSWVFWVQKILRPSMWLANYKEFKFEAASKKDVIKSIHKSRIVIDIEHRKQCGLTMRTFEALGAMKKIITTNHRIREYDFYHPDNVAVIDRDAPAVADSFWISPYRKIPDEIYNNYSIDAWVNEVLELSEK